MNLTISLIPIDSVHFVEVDVMSYTAFEIGSGTLTSSGLLY